MLKVAERPEVTVARAGGWLDRAIPQIGAMIGRLVRAEDTAARLGPEVFALALPATSLSAARLTGERIAAVIACTAFEAGPERQPFVAEFDIGVAEVIPGESAARALEMRRRAGQRAPGQLGDAARMAQVPPGADLARYLVPLGIAAVVHRGAQQPAPAAEDRAAVDDCRRSTWC